MKTKLIINSLLMIFSITIYGQEKEIINPKGNWYFGAEIGSNKISSLTLGEDNTSFQGGLLVEYYFAKNWSLSGRVKYYETGVSFFKKDTRSGGWFDLGSEASYGIFNGSVISIPVNIKWKFRIFKNFSGNLKFGIGYNIELESEYRDFSSNNRTDYSKDYGSTNIGYGFNYFIHKNIAVFIDIETFEGVSRGFSEGFLGDKNYNIKNNLINLGVKFNFNKNK